MNIMVSPAWVLFFAFLTFNAASGNSCGGLLEGEYGHFSLPAASDQEDPEPSTTPCLWIIQLHYRSNVQFTLDHLSEPAHLNVYPEDQLTASGSSYTKLNATHIGSSFEFPGKTLIVIQPNSSSSVAFSWTFVSNNSSVAIMKNSAYVSSPHGLLEWRQLEQEERATWSINSSAKYFNITWNVDIVTSCDASDTCACVYFSIFKLSLDGTLSEAVRTCGESSEGQLKGTPGSFVVLIKVNTKVEANKISVSWGNNDEAKPTVPTATGLFAATDAGLFVFNLQTLEVTSLTSQSTCAVAVNHKLEKLYWSENRDNSRIMRSNFDGSDTEVIVPQTGVKIYALAIEKRSGNVYYSWYGSQDITVCNALGKNCAAIISNSSLVHNAFSIALDSENGVMYWDQRKTPGAHFLVRANLDGSNATIISTGFGDLHGITLGQASNQMLYWTDYGDHTIGSVDVKGGTKRILVELEGKPGPSGIQVDAQTQKIYFYLSGTIQSADRDSGDKLTTVFNTTAGGLNLALFNLPTQHPCSF